MVLPLIARFTTFRNALDAEMREANKLGVAQESKMAERKEITEEEESKLWKLNLLGKTTAESLLHTVYFYNGKLFGLRSNEHRLLRVSNFKIVDNLIIFDESTSKTFHGGLKDLKKEPRLIKHECHRPQKGHSPCLQSIYALYVELVKDTAESIGAFYLRPKRDGSFGYEKSPVGLGTLNKILPEKLCARAGLPRKTSHCLRITCAKRLFQNSVEEKIARQRTGHSSNALFKYQLPSEEQSYQASKILGPSVVSTDDCYSKVVSNMNEEKEKGSVLDDGCSELWDFESDIPDDTLANIILPSASSSFDPDISDEILASIDLPFSTSSLLSDLSDETQASLSLASGVDSIVTNVASNATFNNCSINFILNSK